MPRSSAAGYFTYAYANEAIRDCCNSSFAANTLANRKKEQPSETEVLTEVMQWKQRRRPKLDNSEVAYTIRNLAALRWLKVKPSSDLPILDEIIAEA